MRFHLFIFIYHYIVIFNFLLFHLFIHILLLFYLFFLIIYIGIILFYFPYYFLFHSIFNIFTAALIRLVGWRDGRLRSLLHNAFLVSQSAFKGLEIIL